MWGERSGSWTQAKMDEFLKMVLRHRGVQPPAGFAYSYHSLAAEGRHKFPSTLETAVEERHKSLLSVVLYVCIIGSASSALPVTPLLGIPNESLALVEAHRAEFELPGLHSWPFNTFRVSWQCTPQTLA